MKKLCILICFIALFGCSKSETIPLLPSSTAEISHINNDDLAFVDGYIQLAISKEEAIKRGVPASEYDLVERVLTKHNEGRETQTKSGTRQILQQGILIDPANDYHNNFVSGMRVDAIATGGLILHYTMGADSNGYNYLDYHLYGCDTISGMEQGLGLVDGDVVFPDFWWGFMSLYYTYYGDGCGVCTYTVEEY